VAVRRDKLDHVGVLTIDRPEALNSFNAETAKGLRDQLGKCLDDDDVRALIVTGEGDRAFCAGADIQAFHDAIAKGRASDAVSEVSGLMNEVILGIVESPKPVVAAVNGVAAGGGLGLALACDVRIASQTARFLTAFMNVAVAPDGGVTWLLPRTVGWARAREMLLANRILDAKTVVEWGLVNEIVPAKEVLPRSIEVARRLAQNPRQAMQWTKERLANQRPLAEHLAYEREATIASAATEDFSEGIRAFFEKRKAKFD
jgi:2-(1,2-epoxy-1,2-dihydrophenyl)acetyl-CoA isomerase